MKKDVGCTLYYSYTTTSYYTSLCTFAPPSQLTVSFEMIFILVLVGLISEDGCTGIRLISMPLNSVLSSTHLQAEKAQTSYMHISESRGSLQMTLGFHCHMHEFRSCKFKYWPLNSNVSYNSMHEYR